MPTNGADHIVAELGDHALTKSHSRHLSAKPRWTPEQAADLRVGIDPERESFALQLTQRWVDRGMVLVDLMEAIASKQLHKDKQGRLRKDDVLRWLSRREELQARLAELRRKQLTDGEHGPDVIEAEAASYPKHESPAEQAGKKEQR